jgi:hypothetical protein
LIHVQLLLPKATRTYLHVGQSIASSPFTSPPACDSLVTDAHYSLLRHIALSHTIHTPRHPLVIDNRVVIQEHAESTVNPERLPFSDYPHILALFEPTDRSRDPQASFGSTRPLSPVFRYSINQTSAIVYINKSNH